MGGNKSGRHRLIVRLAEILSLHNIATLRFDYRGSGDSEGNFADTTLLSMKSDTLRAIEYLKEISTIDSQRVGLLGRSFGAIVAIQAAAAVQEFNTKLVRALVLWAPVFDAKPWVSKQEAEKVFSHSVKCGTDPASFYFNGEALNKDFISQFSTYNAVKALASLDHIPIQVITATEDRSLEKYHKEQYERLMKSRDHSECFCLQKSDHDFSDIEEQQVVLNFAKQWFTRYL